MTEATESVTKKSSIPISSSQTHLWSKSDIELGSKDSKDSIDEEKQKSKGWRKFAGMLLTLVSSFVFSLASLIAKLLQGYGFNGNTSSFWRYLGVLLPAIPLLMFFECNARRKTHSSVFDTIWPMNKDNKWKTCIGLVIRGVLGGAAVIFRYYALQYLSLGDTAVITYSSPILVTILAHFLLGERMGFVSVLVTITSLIGVVIIAHPPVITGGADYETETLIGIGLAVGSLVSSSFSVIITRGIRDVHFSLMTLVFGFIGVLEAFVLTQYFDDFKSPEEMDDSLLVVALAVVSFLGQMTIIMAVQFEQAGPVSLLRSCDVIFGFIFQFVFLGIIPTLYSAVGGSVVLTGVLVTGLRKYIGGLPKDDPTRKRFRYILK